MRESFSGRNRFKFLGHFDGVHALSPVCNCTINKYSSTNTFIKCQCYVTRKIHCSRRKIPSCCGHSLLGCYWLRDKISSRKVCTRSYTNEDARPLTFLGVVSVSPWREKSLHRSHPHFVFLVGFATMVRKTTREACNL